MIYIPKQCCETCVNAKMSKDEFSLCVKCNLNKNYISHYKEAEQVTAYRKIMEEQNGKDSN